MDPTDRQQRKELRDSLPDRVQLAPFCLARCCEAFHISKEHLGYIQNEPENVPDGFYIRDMLIEITPFAAKRKYRGWGFAHWEPEPGEHYFTCRHWDPSTRLCTAYKQRPKMCRDHPCGVCNFGCGVTG